MSVQAAWWPLYACFHKMYVYIYCESRLGWVICRQPSQECQSNESRARVKKKLAQVPKCIIKFPPRVRIIYCHTEYLDEVTMPLFGWSVRPVVGRFLNSILPQQTRPAAPASFHRQWSVPEDKDDLPLISSVLNTAMDLDQPLLPALHGDTHVSPQAPSVLPADQQARLNEDDDSEFYSVARFVYHADDGFRQRLESVYRGHLRHNWKVLDLCSSWWVRVDGFLTLTYAICNRPDLTPVLTNACIPFSHMEV
jgi:hypothetical protein